MSEIDDLTYKINGCAMRVHRVLGCGFQEKIYQRCLAIEFQKAGITYEREKEIPIEYETENVGTRRVDFLVDNRVVVELKAMLKIEPVHYAQARNYVQIFGFQHGLLINFGGMKLEIKRVYSHTKQEQDSKDSKDEKDV